MDRPQGRSRWYWWSAAIYLILLASVVWGLISARRWALADLATPQSTAEWEAWRADVRAEQDQPTTGPPRGPQKRRATRLSSDARLLRRLAIWCDPLQLRPVLDLLVAAARNAECTGDACRSALISLLAASHSRIERVPQPIAQESSARRA